MHEMHGRETMHRRAFMGRGMAGLVLALAAARAGAQGAQRTVLVCGDSMMKAVSRSVVRAMAKDTDIKIVDLVSIGTGLARLDLFDWHAQLQAGLAHKPVAAVLIMGTNDNQPMKTADGAVVQTGTPAWTAEYARRVDKAIDILKGGGVQTLIWLGLPDVRDKTLQKDITEINRIVRQQAQAKGVVFVDTVPMFSPTPGTFSPYILKKGGMPMQVRASDGIHLNMDGADFLAARIRQELAGPLKLQP